MDENVYFASGSHARVPAGTIILVWSRLHTHTHTHTSETIKRLEVEYRFTAARRISIQMYATL
jgi:hypothetical protein